MSGATGPGRPEDVTARSDETQAARVGDQAAPHGEGRARAGWRRLVLGPGGRPGRGLVLATVLTTLLGIATSTQIHHTQERGLESLRQDELVGLLDDVNTQSRRLDAEARTLREHRDRLAAEQGQGPAALEEERRRADTAGILAGTVPATGPGVTVRIDDPGGVVDSASVLDAVQELRDAGAEVIQVGPARVVASTAIVARADGRPVVDGNPLGETWTILAIGDPATLSSALAIPGGVVDSVRGAGAKITVATAQRVRVNALHAPSTPRYARNVPTD